MKKPNYAVWIPLMVVGALAIGVILGRAMNGGFSFKSREAGKVGELFELIEREYVDRVDLDSLIEEAIPEMLAGLDPHTAYIPAKDLEAVNSDLEGSFSGIGIQFQMMNDTITVIEVISGGPSERVGLLAGDRIVTVNDSTVAGKKIQMDDVVKMLRGESGSIVKLGIRRHNAEKLLTYNVTRGEIPVTSIDASYLLTPDTGYIKVNKFGRNTFSEFYTEMMMLRADGARNFVLDLRGNSGGFLDVAIRMANEFLPAGSTIVSTRGRDGELQSRVTADGTGSFKDAKVAVLVDEYSASSSEIVAGALQDNDRATIVGRRSFGKGLVQQQYDLSDGSAVRLTTARYYTPSGRCIQKPFSKGDVDNYQLEIYERYASGEAFNRDSIKFDPALLYHTVGGREVYGGGGIMPDIFVPTDTTNVTGYYTSVVNAGLLHRFAFDYTDRHRADFEGVSTTDEVLGKLPSDYRLTEEFVQYAARNGVAPRWYYINISRPLLVNYLKALIARDALGSAAYYEIANGQDKVVERAIQALKDEQ